LLENRPCATSKFASWDEGNKTVHYLYGSKKNVPRRLVATFGSEQQLLAYVSWATLQNLGERRGKFEQGSALAGYDAWERSMQPLTDEDVTAVVHNPTPSML
jgi:hypothetical protein